MSKRRSMREYFWGDGVTFLSAVIKMSTFSMNSEKAMFLEMFISMAATTTLTTTTLTSED